MQYAVYYAQTVVVEGYRCGNGLGCDGSSSGAQRAVYLQQAAALVGALLRMLEENIGIDLRR